MPTTYELAKLNGTQISVDVSSLCKSDKLFFNATEMAKLFGKRPDDFWKQSQNRDYLQALVTLSQGNDSDYIRTKKGGKYQGTWLHNDLALQFARWLDPEFAVRLDKWIKARLNQERDWQLKRLESKTGFRPLTDAIERAHDPAKHYHYSNECDLINRIVLGVSAKAYRLKHGVADVRDHLPTEQLADIEYLQRINSSLIDLEMPYAERKVWLTSAFHKRHQGIAA